MRYTFQDSIDLPVQRDFIQDLQDFIVISKEGISLERETVKIKEDDIRETEAFEQIIKEIDELEKDITTYLESRTSEVQEDIILEIKSTILETLSTVTLAKKNEKLEEIKSQQKLDLIEIEQLKARITSILSPFFENSIYGAENTYNASVEEKKLKGKQIGTVNGMRYEFELDFTQENFKVKDFQNLILPIWVKSGILTRENKVKKLDISDFHIVSIEYDGSKLRTILGDRESENRFTVSADENSLSILHRDYELIGDQELAPSINIESVNAFITKLKRFFIEYVGSKTLVSITLDGEDVFEMNRVFDCLKIIASIYGQLVAQCIEKGYNPGEIAIKIEESGRIRTEKYLEKSEILSELSAAGREGKELATILRVTET